MRSARRSFNAGARALLAIGFAIVLSAAPGFAADLDGRHAWTTIGSAGVPDDSAIDRVAMTRGKVCFKPQAAAGALLIRYNIEATDALVGTMGPGDGWDLRVAFRDAGSNDRVQVFLMQYDPEDNRVKAVEAFDSDTREADAQPAVRTVSHGLSGLEFDFESKLYYLAVLLTKQDAGLGPAFHGASLIPASATP